VPRLIHQPTDSEWVFENKWTEPINMQLEPNYTTFNADLFFQSGQIPTSIISDNKLFGYII